MRCFTRPDHTVEYFLLHFLIKYRDLVQVTSEVAELKMELESYQAVY